MTNGTLAENVGRGDILLLRGITNRLAVKWERDSGSGFKPVDLTDYMCTFELRLTGSEDVVYSRACDAHDIDGVAAVYIPPDVFAIPGPMGDVTPAASQARDEAVAAARYAKQSAIDTIQNQLLVGENFRRIFQRLNALDGLGK